MPLTDTDRITAEQLTPHVLELWRALVPLKTVVSFMNTGAHPDDEHSALLAALSLRDGMDVSFACSTRGEGGQNNLGTHAGPALGVLRTAEMERACDVLNLRLHWLSQSPGHSIADFGFSKSGEDTLNRWGKALTVKRMVDILRLERPDIICPTFLDVPGQHGHHRAMTETAERAFDLAADPTYTDSDLPPWQVRKMYLPAWSGAGQSYDDEAPPPPESTCINMRDPDPVTGWSYARIGQQSRVFHASQGMGDWVPAGAEQDYPLHLLRVCVDAPENSLVSGLPRRLEDLTLPQATRSLARAQVHMDAAIACFPDAPAILKEACAALSALREAITLCPADLAPEVLHKLTRKETQLSRLIRIAARVEIRGRLSKDVIPAGGQATLTLEQRNGQAQKVDVTPRLPEGWRYAGDTLHLDVNADPCDPYPDSYFPDSPAAPCLDLTISAHGIAARTALPFEITPLAAPARAVPLAQETFVLNLATGGREVTIDLFDALQRLPDLQLRLPDGWRGDTCSGQVILTLPQGVTEGLFTLPLHSGGKPVQTLRLIQADHIAPRLQAMPARVTIRVLSADLPMGRVGYIGAGNDRIDHWLAQIGADVTALAEDDLGSAEHLAQFDSLIIGVFAMKMRPDLSKALPLLHDWTRAGGTLVTLYHRPWDNWDPDHTPPERLEIGQPSLRWRVTDETAPVTLRDPEHELLTAPNRIGTEDWAGWQKERGLYFAKSWSAAYTPLLSMSDPGEEPLLGALLTADIGAGRHVHTSLILHHQMEMLVPGAYRLMANLLARRSPPIT